MEDRLMTIKQLAGYLNLNERTVLRLVTDGALPGMKLGNQWRFRKAMIDTWLDDQMLGVTPRLVDEPKQVVPARAQRARERHAQRHRPGRGLPAHHAAQSAAGHSSFHGARPLPAGH